MDSQKFQDERQTDRRMEKIMTDRYRDIGKIQTKGKRKDMKHSEKKPIRNVDQANKLTDRQTNKLCISSQ